MLDVLFIMDPIVDLDPKFDDRSAVALKDLCAVSLGMSQKIYNDISVSFLGLKSLLDRKDIRNTYKKANIKIFEIDDTKINNILQQTNSSTFQAFNNCHGKLKERLIDLIKDCMRDYRPNIILYWESCSEIIKEYFDYSVQIELSRSGFYRIEGNHDILFNIKYRKQSIDSKAINLLQLCKNDVNDLNKFRKEFSQLKV